MAASGSFSRWLGNSFLSWMLAEHCPANLAPRHECLLFGRRLPAREGCFLLKEEHVYQIRDHLAVALIAFFAVLFRVAIHISGDHMITVALGGETHDANTDARPTTMEEGRIILPVNEPFVLHLLRYQPQPHTLNLAW